MSILADALLGKLVSVFFHIYIWIPARSPANINLQHKVGSQKSLTYEWNFTSPLPSFRILTYSDHKSVDRGTSVVQAMNNPHLISHSAQDMTWRLGCFKDPSWHVPKTTMHSTRNITIRFYIPICLVDLPWGEIFKKPTEIAATAPITRWQPVGVRNHPVRRSGFTDQYKDPSSGELAGQTFQQAPCWSN